MGIALSLAAGVGLGLSLAAPPGALNALIAREAGRHGFLPAVKTGLGAPVADVLFLAILVLGLDRVLEVPGLVRVAAAAGAVLMAYFAVTTWRSPDEAPEEGLPRATFAAAFAMAITNPYQIGWWVSGGYVFLQRQGLWGMAGLLVGIFGWVVGFSWLVSRGAQRWAWFKPVVRLGSALLLGAFSVLLLLVAADVGVPGAVNGS